MIFDPRGYDAVVLLRARQSVLAYGLEERHMDAVKQWIAKEWPFRSVACPGRGMSWDN